MGWRLRQQLPKSKSPYSQVVGFGARCSHIAPECQSSLRSGLTTITNHCPCPSSNVRVVAHPTTLGPCHTAAMVLADPLWIQWTLLPREDAPSDGRSWTRRHPREGPQPHHQPSLQQQRRRFHDSSFIVNRGAGRRRDQPPGPPCAAGPEATGTQRDRVFQARGRPSHPQAPKAAMLRTPDPHHCRFRSMPHFRPLVDPPSDRQCGLRTVACGRRMSEDALDGHPFNGQLVKPDSRARRGST